MKTNGLGWFATVLLVGIGYASAQGPEKPTAPVDSGPIAARRVGEILKFLASDELAGRDTPSPGLERAARFLADGFKAAGLRPVGKDGSYLLMYEQPGVEVDSTKIALTIYTRPANGEQKNQDEASAEAPEQATKLVGDVDVRLLTPPRQAFARSGKESEALVIEESLAGRRLGRAASRKPVLIVVDEAKSALWKVCGGKRQLFDSPRMQRAPWLLVRAKALPKGTVTRIDVKVPEPQRVTLKLHNVAALWPGTDRAKELVMFSAHYDHLGVKLPRRGDWIFNGADDDASGTTAVLALAEAFAKHKTKLGRSLLFVCYSGEEKGMLGSRAFAENPPVRLADVVANLNLEMLGRPMPGKQRCCWITGRDLSDFEQVATRGLKRAGIECIEFAQARGLFYASDNISLVRKGVVAHSISAGSLHSDYHRPTDEFAKIDLPHMTAVIHGIYEAGLEFANRAGRPRYNERGEEMLERMR
ncbi:MAG: M28 family peptidase [Planctomycetes bacterium]|nr:M28 family peptidase [Planctomycetota bacterium]MCB9870936.1 M28 family peptidase [Planctomycetota bacterium]MCB9888300.1 M28 family peptidase [Planctomycetota bacterium]